jgi:hypothetical protein
MIKEAKSVKKTILGNLLSVSYEMNTNLTVGHYTGTFAYMIKEMVRELKEEKIEIKQIKKNDERSSIFIIKNKNKKITYHTLRESKGFDTIRAIENEIKRIYLKNN